jgi:ketol-acid reductoisomerase
LHELKLIVDLIYEGGFARMHQYVSDTAKYGDLTRGPRVVDEHTRAQMQKILDEIRNGTFAKEWMAENENGCPKYKKLLADDLNHPVEEVGARLRANMAWLAQDAAKGNAPKTAVGASSKRAGT